MPKNLSFILVDWKSQVYSSSWKAPICAKLSQSFHFIVFVSLFLECFIKYCNKESNARINSFWHNPSVTTYKKKKVQIMT